MWLKSISKTADKEESPFFLEGGAQLFNSEEIERKITGLKFDDETNEIVKITRLIASQYLVNGFPILAAGSYISIKDFYTTVKVLVQANEMEIAYLIVKSLKIKSPFDKEIILNLCLRELKNKKLYNIS